jgi:hypothetical protein
MWKDEIVEETRRWRDELAARYNYDAVAICRALIEVERQAPERVVAPPARRSLRPRPGRRSVKKPA